MARTILHDLSDFGQSIWLDYISRSLMKSGKLKGLISQGLRGMTSNPTIFNQAISMSSDYDDKIIALTEAGRSIFEIYDELTIADIQSAADAFRDVYQETHGLDGYVSLEINPHLAGNTEKSIEEGKRLFTSVNRPNVMIKVPSTPEGFPVIEELLASGINVNVTLIFSIAQYEKTAQAYLSGMERLAKTTSDLSVVRSVASFFVSRIDTAIDQILNQQNLDETNPVLRAQREALIGRAAVANCQIAFAKFQEIFTDERFARLRQKGADVQRLLWASTGTKNPHYSDIKYITELISKPTVNTVPEKTLNAFLDHGTVHPSFVGQVPEAKKIVSDLQACGIRMETVCQKLLKEGVEAFERSFRELLDSLTRKAQSLSRHP